MDSTHSFGYWLRRRRKALDLTQLELAQRVSCSPDLIQKIEADARRPSRQLAEKLATCLGIGDAERERFIQAARAERAVDRLALTTQPVEQPDVRPINLLAQPTALIGRKQHLARLEALLLQPDVRLVTLTGPGGIGKTRLALQVAADLLLSDSQAFPPDREQDSQNEQLFRHGTWFVNLAPIADPNLAASAIAQVLGVRESGGQPLLDSLKSYLRDKRILLLLDNFEQIADAAPAVAELGTRKQLNIPV